MLVRSIASGADRICTPLVTATCFFNRTGRLVARERMGGGGPMTASATHQKAQQNRGSTSDEIAENGTRMRRRWREAYVNAQRFQNGFTFRRERRNAFQFVARCRGWVHRFQTPMAMYSSALRHSFVTRRHRPAAIDTALVCCATCRAKAGARQAGRNMDRTKSRYKQNLPRQDGDVLAARGRGSARPRPASPPCRPAPRDRPRLRGG